jgi:hypothetical protein
MYRHTDETEKMRFHTYTHQTMMTFKVEPFLLDHTHKQNGNNQKGRSKARRDHLVSVKLGTVMGDDDVVPYRVSMQNGSRFF